MKPIGKYFALGDNARAMIALSVFYLFMVIVFAMTIARHAWMEVAIAAAMCFAVYVATFLVGSVGAVLETIGEWIMDIIMA